MDLPWRLGAASALVLALSACSSDLFFSEQDLHAFCGDNPEKRIEAANWDDAEAIDVQIRLGSFWPMILTLRQDRPYILRIANIDPERRVFSATSLFQSSYLQSVTVAGQDPEFNPIDGLRLPPAGTAEVRMIALCAGRFEFFEAWLTDWRFETSQGVIYVE